MAPPALVLENRYRLDDRIAEGGMGEVWQATDLLLARPVAVKLLRPAYSQDELGLTRFRAEAQYAGSLSHPNIARIYDYGSGGTAAQPYLVMELVDGPSLAGLLAGGPLPPGRALEIVAQAAAGLQAAHAAGLVHRDIKPGNLLISGSGQVKIADFGIAHAVGSTPVTRTGELVGTPAYLSPEQAAGRSASPASDLYGLGIVAYQCLAGEPPFAGEPLAIALAHQDQPLPPLPGSVPPAVAALVSHLAAKDPAARPASAGEVAKAAGRLLAALSGESVTLPGTPAAGGVAVPVTWADVPPGPVPRADPATAQGLPLAIAAPAVLAPPAAHGAQISPAADAGPAGQAGLAAEAAHASPAAGTGAPAGQAATTAPAPGTTALAPGMPVTTVLNPDRPAPPGGPPAAGSPAAAGQPGQAQPALWRRRNARFGLAAAGVAVFGLTGLALTSLPGAAPGHDRTAAPPSAHPAGPASGPAVTPSGTPGAQTVATPGTGRSRRRAAHPVRPSPAASPTASATTAPTTAPPTPPASPGSTGSPSPAPSGTPTASATALPAG